MEKESQPASLGALVALTCSPLLIWEDQRIPVSSTSQLGPICCYSFFLAYLAVFVEVRLHPDSPSAECKAPSPRFLVKHSRSGIYG